MWKWDRTGHYGETIDRKAKQKNGSIWVYCTVLMHSRGSKTYAKKWEKHKKHKNKPIKRGWRRVIVWGHEKDSKKRTERRCCRDDNLKIPQDGGGRFKEKREQIRRIERERHTKVEEENKQLIKGRGLEMERMSCCSFFFTILLRNLWVICCRGKTFCLLPLKNRLN